MNLKRMKELAGGILEEDRVPHHTTIRSLTALAVSDEWGGREARRLLKMYCLFSIIAKADVFEALINLAKKDYDSNRIYWITQLFTDIAYNYPLRWYSFDEGEEENKKKSQPATGKQFPYISSSQERLPEIFERYKQYKGGKKFIDIGSGIGDKTFIASMFSDMKCYGLEYDQAPVVIADELKWLWPKANEVKFIRADAFDFKDFGQFDRIYTYQPLRDRDALKAFYLHIWKQLPKGALWFEYGGPLEKALMGRKDVKWVGEKRNDGYGMKYAELAEKI